MVAKAERISRDRKIISVSPKRQVTIPLKFFKQLELGTEVECFMQNDAIVIRPFSSTQNEFSVEILRDLVAAGFLGDELVKRFEVESQKIRKAIQHMTEEAERIASGEISAATLDDIFGEDAK